MLRLSVAPRRLSTDAALVARQTAKGLLIGKPFNRRPPITARVGTVGSTLVLDKRKRSGFPLDKQLRDPSRPTRARSVDYVALFMQEVWRENHLQMVPPSSGRYVRATHEAFSSASGWPVRR